MVRGLNLMIFVSLFAVVQGQQGQTPWTAWTLCSVSCAGGTQTRSRECFDGNLCSLGVLTENRNCGTQPCPIHGGWEIWESWVSCSVTCGGGRSSRQRTCDAPVPEFGGRFCMGGNASNIDIENVEWEWRDCNTQPCVVDGAWTLWSKWSTCTKTCNGGTTSRNRTCTNPAPAHGGLDCVDMGVETMECNTMIPCPIDGGWQLWSEWNYCSTSCKGGYQYRIRDCTNPFPYFGGKDCIGSTKENRTCNDNIPCPVNGEWQAWGLWSACSSNCTGGKKTRTRECSTPLHGGIICKKGTASESLPCNENVACPIHGKWTLWNQWSGCSSTCAGGNKTRSRTCTNPAPSLGGNDCVGVATEASSCNDNIGCPVNGAWGQWSLWDACTSPCGGGQQSRRRSCNSPAPMFGGLNCGGSEVETRNCNLDVAC